MAIQSNLDYQTFWAPRPSSRPRCVAGQSHIRPLPQPKSSPLPLNYSRGMIGVSKESPDSSPRLASTRDDVIYISDDAASNIKDASHGLFDESLPSIQALVQSLEDAEKMGNAADDGFEQPSQRKDAHDAGGLSTDSTPPEQELFNESEGPTVDMAAEFPCGISASTSRMCTHAPTSMTDGSRIGSSSCEPSLQDAESPHARGSSVSADDESAKKPSVSQIAHRVDRRLEPHSLVSQPWLPPSPLDDDCTRGGMTLRESLGPSQKLASTKDDLFDVFDTALGHTDASCDQSSDETLPPVRNAVPSLEETREIRSIVDDGEQISDSGNEREPIHGPHSSTLRDHRQINHDVGFSFAEPADCLAEDPSSMSRTRSPIASTRVSPRLNSLSPESQVWGIVSTQTSCTSLSALGNGEDEMDDQTCTGTEPPEKVANDSNEREYRSDDEPLMSPMLPRTQNKRSRESLVIEQSEAEGLREVVDDPEYYPLPSDESEDASDSPSGGEEQASPKRRKFRAEPSKLQSRSKQRAHSKSAVLNRASVLTSAAQEDAPAVAEPTDAAFDEWILQDVVLKRTIIDGKATFLFQFDWDFCAKYGQAARKPCKRSKQPGYAQPIVKNNGRRRFTALEDQWLAAWKEEQGLCWAEIHSLFCAKFEERSKEALQVRYCTRIKQHNYN